MLIRSILVAITLLLIAAPLRADNSKITLSSLLDEMIDRDAVARFPRPEYVAKQRSSYDPRSTSAADKETWFANFDCNQFLRQEKHGDHTEYVMHDVAGPGCVVRIWITDSKPDGMLRIYLDGSEQPALQGKPIDLMSGKGPVKAPLSEYVPKGWNLYLPIPYASHCKITYEKPGPTIFYYHVGYRTYPSSTAVETFSMDALDAAKAKVDQVQKTLLDSASSLPDKLDTQKLERELSTGQSLEQIVPGPAAVQELVVKIEAADMRAALRSTVIGMTCDGEETVWAPLGDFFGSGVGVNPYHGWYRSVDKTGEMTCYWVMPIKEQCKIRLTNLGDQNVKAQLATSTGQWKWDDRSMHFRANWREETFDSTDFRDWNYISAKGKGVYVGDSLAIYNPVDAWWGEGDEKICIDGETFPSFIGTGTEDYYGYGWCGTKYFSTPFHAQPCPPKDSNFGHTSVTRVRLLDGIPFNQSIDFNIEAWHCSPNINISYAATTYWYALPGATSNRGPEPDHAKVIETPTPATTKLAGVIEGEDLKPIGKPPGKVRISQEPQSILSGGQQLSWSTPHDGDELKLALPVEKAGKYAITLSFTVNDPNSAQISIDGQPLGEHLDGFGLHRPLYWTKQLGTRDLSAGEHTLSIKMNGSIDGESDGGSFKIDYIKLEPIQ